MYWELTVRQTDGRKSDIMCSKLMFRNLKTSKIWLTLYLIDDLYNVTTLHYKLNHTEVIHTNY